MNWQVICHVGAEDSFEPTLNWRDPRLVVDIERPGRESSVGQHVRERLSDSGLTVEDTVIDLVHLAMAAYTADLRIGRATANDQWHREITLYMPVADTERWSAAKLAIERLLSFLTGDSWELRFRGRGALVDITPRDVEQRTVEAVSLFSGGLDSFIGAIDLLEGAETTVALVGQYGYGSTNVSQKNALGVLADFFGTRAERFGFFVHPAKRDGQGFEDTMRSRSILFLALGTAVSSAYGGGVPLYVPENGLISLNVPLTASRMGSLSTRTTHPYLIRLYGEVLEALGIDTPVVLPYRFSTKGEMLYSVKNQDALKRGLDLTLSCAHPEAARFERRSPGTHCGYCVPCIIRHAAIHAAVTAGGASVGVLPPPEVSRRTGSRGRDLRAFEIAVEGFKALSPLRQVNEVLHAGPLPPAEVGQYAGVYRRGMTEVGRYLESIQ